jgi:hypothetical protein
VAGPVGGPSVLRVGSGIIYAVIIVMWAAYFIPRWLRRHEELSESRSVEKFDHAMRILSRRDPTPDKRYVVMPPRPEPAPSSLPERGRVPAQRSAPVRRRVGTAAIRRRRILAGLVLTTLVVGLLTPLTPLPWWAPVLLPVVTLADLVHLRVQVRRTRELSRTRHAVRRSVRSRLMRFDALDRLMTVRREMAEDRAAEEARWAETEEALRLEREAEERRTAAEAAGWSPVPVPLPTYVSKPMAPRRAPAIDLTKPGAWSDAQVAGAQVVEQRPFDQHVDTRAVPASMSALVDDAEGADDQLDAIIERRAVND